MAKKNHTGNGRFGSNPDMMFRNLSKELSEYLGKEEISFVYKAFRCSYDAHQGQKRKSGEPYVTHPVAVAEVLCRWRLDHQAIAAAILHDVIEDTGATFEQIRSLFGLSVAELVDGVSKITRITIATKDKRAENFGKMLLAMARDMRVIMIKLADRLHNMRTLSAMPLVKRKSIAKETMEIYAPIAHRLGLNDVFQELQTLSFQFLYPWRFNIIRTAVDISMSDQNKIIESMVSKITEQLNKSKIFHIVTGREKNPYSIYNKMKLNKLSFSQVTDIFGIRIIVQTVRDCYLCLGEVHNIFRPFPGQFKDYIALPKNNGYQSLHTSVMGPHGNQVEIQIRTQDMQNVAESGLAAHWLYKSNPIELTELQKNTHIWLQSLLEIQRSSNSAQEFLEYVKIDLFPDEVYVFTPRGEIKTLPKGATAIDFAYNIHTNVGHKAIGCKINGLSGSLKTELKSGDMIEVILGDTSNPKISWLNYVRSARARLSIRNFLRTRQYDESIALGERLLARSLSSLGISLSKNITDKHWENYFKRSGYTSKESAFADLGLGKSAATIVARSLVEEEIIDKNSPPEHPTLPYSGDIAIRTADCCRPIPGDTIVGIVGNDKGLTIHTCDCTVARKQISNKCAQTIDIEWGNTKHKMFSTSIAVLIENRRGVLGKLTSKIAETGSDISSVVMEDAGDNNATIHLSLSVYDRKHLAAIFRKVRIIPESTKVWRTTQSERK
ncbi:MULTISPECIES: RelA/SpoT family protein [Candidatus Ichthyocystis]|uniref:Guanosine-3',5'-bis pyrophosphate 3'-pyrophosphohydrolase n=1 Tax=Candidatus Ichthyocystis hellenicum TaxID=1561003 RepID=A0A0S4M0E4_9BURK|nr:MULTISPECIES: bifunctional (p)ppGpp synthetase/guanosine-3',5'-bis(diphosphate) 3'-pyrophosphohydrolase [Ichthyocystis]CUT17271.1 guanosine-3',5'-bis pyrophosphate 3'-pyrophosphohydrolase [Candidatus Ichthyocystis hellenicum]